LPEQLEEYFPDIQDQFYESALGLVHSRFSTNTFPNWERAHPNRMIAHNGEINTLRGNISWLHARQSLLKSKYFKNNMEKLLPVIDPEGSDSAMFDNCFELLSLSGRTMPHAMMMMIPEPWNKHESMDEDRKAFYEYHSCLMEPWDGPASVAFTNGEMIGAILDRNGLRPSRYYITKDKRVIMASEVGVLKIAPKDIESKGRLKPGRMFLVDLKEKRIVGDGELKSSLTTQSPYKKWMDKNRIFLKDLEERNLTYKFDKSTLFRKQKAFGYTAEDIRLLLTAMAEKGMEALGSMGTDTPLAVLSDRPKLLYTYFKQLFAQVTNPPIDAIREEIITSTVTHIGSEGNLLADDEINCRSIRLERPILNNEELEKFRQIDRKGFKSRSLSMLFSIDEGFKGIEKRLEEIYKDADQAIKDGVNVLILSDRNVDEEKAAIPALLFTSGLHHHLIRNENRTKVALIVESGEPREVHHFALLIGYGASAVNPFLAFETLESMVKKGNLQKENIQNHRDNYIKAAVKGVIKILSKMGISTVHSYKGAQIFEAIGLKQSFIDKYFTWTASRVEGIDLSEVAIDVLKRHAIAYEKRASRIPVLDSGGEYKWRQDGEKHLLNPMTVHKLQRACQTGDYKIFKEYSELVNDQSHSLYTLRGLFELNWAKKPLEIDKVESVESICKRFKTGPF